MVSFPDKNRFVKVFKNEFFCPNQGPSRFCWGVNTWKVFSFWLGFEKSHMVENCTNTILDERGYVSSCGVNTWKVLSFWRGLEKSHMVENWYEYHFR